ncbi:MAG: hypothetical protein HGA78_10915, partial [Nitrospirales bacterium]|nr:hypothetical protein [Nitrospirales bacterium]
MKTENKFIWTAEQLESLSGHKNPIVREWAMERLRELYPERAGETALRLLSDRDTKIAFSAAVFIQSHADEKYADRLLEIYKKSSGPIIAKIAGALAKIGDRRLISAFRERYRKAPGSDPIGYTLSVVCIASLGGDDVREIVRASLSLLSGSRKFSSVEAAPLFQAYLTADMGVEGLISFCLEQKNSSELMRSALAEICRSCGAWYKEQALKVRGDEELPYIVSNTLDLLHEIGWSDTAERIETLFKNGRHTDALAEIGKEADSILDRRKQEVGDTAFAAWMARQEPPFRSIQALSALQRAGKEAGAFSQLIAAASLAIFFLLAECSEVIGVLDEELDTEAALAFFFQKRGDLPADPRIAERLINSPDRDKVISQCLAHLEQHQESWANGRTTDLLEQRMNKEIAARLLKTDPTYDSLWSNIVDAVSKLGPLAVDVARPYIEAEDSLRAPYLLEILESIPTDESVELILSRWDSLWDRHKEELLEAVRCIGDRRFIEPLKGVLKEEEPDENEAFYLLCLVNDATDPLLKKVERYLEKEKKRTEKLERAVLNRSAEDIINEPLMMPLRCRECGKAYTYPISHIMVGIDTVAPFIYDVVLCKNCKALDSYEITSEGMVALSGRLMLLVMAGSKASLGRGTIVRGEAGLIDGKRMTFDETISYFRKKLDKDPVNVELLIRYANTLRKAKRAEDSIPVYERAMELDPLAVDAYVALGQMAEEKNEIRKAYELLKKAADIIHTGHFYRAGSDIDRFEEAFLEA